MNWFKPRQFRSPQEAAVLMVDLLAAEGEVVGVPLTDEEREILAGDGAMSEELRLKAHLLVGSMFDGKTGEDSDRRSFDSAMLLAQDPTWPNVVDIAVQVATERNPHRRLRGWALAQDRIQLVGCGLLAVLLMFVIVAVAGFIFHWK
jgi:hypothetical protein